MSASKEATSMPDARRLRALYSVKKNGKSDVKGRDALSPRMSGRLETPACCSAENACRKSWRSALVLEICGVESFPAAVDATCETAFRTGSPSRRSSSEPAVRANSQAEALRPQLI